MFNSLIEVEVIFIRKVYCAWSHCEIQRKGRGGGGGGGEGGGGVGGGGGGRAVGVGLELGSRLSWRDDSVMGSSQPKSQEVVQKNSCNTLLPTKQFYCVLRLSVTETGTKVTGSNFIF